MNGWLFAIYIAIMFTGCAIKDGLDDIKTALDNNTIACNCSK